MLTFTASDGTELAYHVRGEGEPLVVLPGGPMTASEYLGDLGGLTAHRTLFLLDPRGTGDSAKPVDPSTYRCDRQVGDVEALRVRLGLDRMDLLAHSAAGSLAVLYAARHPERVRRLALITSTPRALGLAVTDEDRRAAARLRAEEGWYSEAYPSYEAWLGGADTDLSEFGGFFYGRWDDAARAHLATVDAQINDEACELFHSDGAYDPPATVKALAGLGAPVLVLAGELDPALAERTAALFPYAEVAVQPGAGHYPWLDDPHGFVRRVNTFLRSAE
ncbi:alpha/beta hydrolase [Streptomyces acidiscabies]|uniref:alpha/beta fold hydrolase n=1 Tax=Streptomyces acidiscabies TaxID=42234 RepID=UPI0030D3B0CE